MKRKQLKLGKGFRVAFGNARAQGAEMVIPPGDAEGDAENRLDAMRLAKLWHFRPAYIHPGHRIEKPLPQDRLMRPLARLLRPFKGAMTADLLNRMRAMGRENRTKIRPVMTARRNTPLMISMVVTTWP